MDQSCSHHDTSPLLCDALSQLAACADQLAAGNPAQPDREAVARYMDALEHAISRCFARPELGCWLDVLCPLKENLHSLCAYAGSAGPAPVDPELVTATVVLTHLALSLARQPAESVVARRPRGHQAGPPAVPDAASSPQCTPFRLHGGPLVEPK